MKRIKLACLRSLLSVIILLFASISANANHILGMDFSYAWISGNTYQLTVVIYGNCSAASASSGFRNLYRAAPVICIYNGNTYITSTSLTIDSSQSFLNVTPVCPSDTGNTTCTNLSSTIQGVEKYTYTGTYTVPAASNVWRFVFDGDLGPDGVGGRATAIVNIVGASGTNIHLVDTLNNTVGDLHNTSPILSVLPTPFFCEDQNDNYNPGAVDPDGDSLSFYLVPGLDGSDNCTATVGNVSYVTPYTATAPLPTSTSTFSFNQATGQISFNPTLMGEFLVVYNIEEYRSTALGKVLVGTSQREMTFIIITCTNPTPTGGIEDTTATNGTVDDSTHFHICQYSGPFNLYLNPTEPGTTNNITVSATGLPTGCTLTTTGNGTPTPHSVITWTSDGVAPGSYTFYITYTDNNCPLTGQETFGITITIYAGSGIGYAVLSPETCTQREAIQITPTGTSPFTIDETAPGGDSVLNVTGPFTDSLSTGTYKFQIQDGSPQCADSFIVTVTAPPALHPAASGYSNPTYCDSNNGTITLQHLIPGTTDTIQFYENGTLTSQTGIVTADSTLKLNELPAGEYNDFLYLTADNICVSIAPGPVALTGPPYTPPPVIGSNTPICLGQTLNLTATDDLAGGTYLWTFADGSTSTLQNPSIDSTTLADSGIYTVTYNTITCASTTTQNVALDPPIKLINVTPNTLIQFGASIHLNADGALYYWWRPDNGSLDNPNINDPVATPQHTTLYTVIGTSLYGCTDSANILISVDSTENILIPTAFSPNNDGRNDIFRIRNVTHEQLNDFCIYNRWGQLIYHNTYDIQQGWDGTFNGVPQDMGVYNYVIIVSFPDGPTKMYKGDVTLIR